MDFNINEAMAQMLKAIKGQIGSDWSDASSEISTIMSRKKDRLELLAKLRITGKITQSDFESFLEDEKTTTVIEMHTVAIISKVTAENAANAAINVLKEIVQTAISAAMP